MLNILKARYVVLDLETTGLDTESDEPVQVAYAIIDHGKTDFTGHVLVRASIPSHPQAEAVHGLTSARLETAKPFEELAPRLYDLLKDSIVIGHNALKFDVPMLARMFRQALPNTDAAAWSPSVFDTCLWSRKLTPKGRHTLKAAAERWKVDMGQHHEAWHDVRTAWSLFTHFIKACPELRELTPEEAIQHQAEEFKNFTFKELTLP